MTASAPVGAGGQCAGLGVAASRVAMLVTAIRDVAAPEVEVAIELIQNSRILTPYESVK